MGQVTCADGTQPFQLTVDYTNPPTSFSGFLPFGGFKSMIDVRTTITLTGGANGAGFDDLLTQTDVISAIPEPATLGLAAIALLAMVGWRRRVLAGR